MKNNTLLKLAERLSSKLLDKKKIQRSRNQNLLTEAQDLLEKIQSKYS